jgi:ABC-type antimicrobial peptide transport system permease subunit
MKYDTYTSILLLILIIGPFKLSIKELFTTTTMPATPAPTIPTIVKDGLIIADIPKPTATFLQDTVNSQKLLDAQVLGIDNRFKTDDVAVREILRQIKSQVDFDPYKTNLGKDTIYEIYNKYFDNDIFKKLKKTNDDSKDYLAAGNFEYIPTVAQVDYDLITYQNLSDNVQLGVNPISDGINNKTKINRG